MQSTAQPRHQRRIPLPWRLMGLLALAVIGTAIWLLLTHSEHEAVPIKSSEASHSAPSIPVTIEHARTTLSPQSLEVTGTVQSELQAAISSKVMARVQSVLVREGDHVRRGQALVLLDARDLEASIAQAGANLRAASVGYENARVAARMEASLSVARIAEAQSKIGQSSAALEAATAKLELVQAGPRPQERTQALLAVAQSKSNLTLAESNMKRMGFLFEGGAISAQQYEQVKSLYEVAKSQYEATQQGKSISDEGSRAEEIRASQQAVRQAQAAVQEANAGLKSAQASALQTEVRKQDIQGARAQIGQSQAGLQLAKVVRDYATLTAPFDGVITKRTADPGVMASPGVQLLTLEGGAQRLEAIVPESLLRFVHKGAAVPLSFDALRNRAPIGRVAEIAPQGDPGSHTFIVKIDIRPGSRAAAGMFGRARLTTGEEKRLLIPASALWEREGLHYVYVVDASRVARMRMITVGDAVGERVPVLSGLSEGDPIVAAGKERLTDGSAVNGGAR